MQKIENALASNKNKLSALKHISAIDLYKYYIEPAFKALNLDCEANFEAVSDALEGGDGGLDPEDADLLKGTIASLAALVEELLLSNGYIEIKTTSEGVKAAAPTEKMPAGMWDRLALLNEATVESLDLLEDDGDEEDEDDEDDLEGEGDEEDEGSLEETLVPPAVALAPEAVAAKV